YCYLYFFFSSRRRHTRFKCDWSSDVCSSDLAYAYQNGANRIAFIGAGESALPALMDDQSRHLFAIVALSPGPLGTLTANDLRGKIGRASCRERVESWVGGGVWESKRTIVE